MALPACHRPQTQDLCGVSDGPEDVGGEEGAIPWAGPWFPENCKYAEFASFSSEFTCPRPVRIIHLARCIDDLSFSTDSKLLTQAQSVPTPKSVRSKRNICTVCFLEFPTSQLLEQHAKAAFHRLYQCPYSGCNKSYYRRDVFVRHKSAHKRAGFHKCAVCKQCGEEKIFNRKDHLAQHIRNCHSDGPGSPYLIDEEYAMPPLEHVPMRWFAADHETLDIPTLPNDSDMPEDEGLSDCTTWSSRSSVSRTLEPQPQQHQTVTDLGNALTALVGHDSYEFSVLTHHLGLHKASTKEQMATRLKTVLIPALDKSDNSSTSQA
jgi:hypothetical protein